MDLQLANGMWMLKIDMVQAVALAIITYYVGVYIKSKSPTLQKLSLPAPVIGGLPFAFILSALKVAGILSVKFDGTLQTVALLAFFTTVGMMASLQLVKRGGMALALFWFVSAIFGAIQNLVGMGIATTMGIDFHYGILAGAVSLMGGLGTSAAFGPFFEQTYGIQGATTVAITAATFGMAIALIMGGPFGEKMISMYHIKTPKQANPHLSEGVESMVIEEDLIDQRVASDDVLKALGFVVVAMGFGSILSYYLGQIITLPAYIGSMLCAAVIRNFGDFSGKYTIEGPGLNCVADISLVLYVTMAINSLKLDELIHLALPLIVILIVQTILMALFAWLVYFMMFGKDYDAVMLAVGGIGFAMGATANGLANMQSLGEKYGPSPRAWLIVSLVGAFLVDFTNAIIITWMGSW